jgi:hypothetical protein
MIRKNGTARADPPSGDDDGFVDIDELLLGVIQESINSDSIAEEFDRGTRGGSPANSTRPTEGSSQGKHPAFPHLIKILNSPDYRSDYTKRRRI